jgi:hypothetical protein
MSESRRALYRIAYPAAERPIFIVGLSICEIVDCSETGLRYDVRERHTPPVGAKITGTIQLRSGGKLPVSGTVVRVDQGYVALALESPVPFANILTEQRWLRAKGYTLRD